MKISTKGRYAMRLLIDLYENQGDGFVALKDIAARQDISKKYLEQIVPALTGDGILKTSRGFQGGYRLARETGGVPPLAGEPEDIPVGDILRLTEGSLAPVACLDSKSNECPRCADCLTLPLWQGLERVINEYLDGVSLRDVIDGNIK